MVLRIMRGWPLPPWVYPSIALVMAALTFAVNRSLLQSAYPLWFQLSTAWHESLLIPGTLLATLAVPIGSALSQKASPVTPGGRPREGVGLMLAHAVALGAWAAVGHAAGMTPAALRAVNGATWGTLNWQDVAIGTLGVGMLAVVGFCAGALLRRWLLAPVVGLIVFIAFLVPDSTSTRPLGLFGPVRQYTTSTRFEVTLATTVFGVLAMICLSMAIAHVATWARRRTSAYQGRMEPVAWVTLVIGLAITAFIWRPELYTVNEPVPRACKSSGQVQICLHQANEPARDDITTATADVSQAGLSPLLQRVTDEAASETDQPSNNEAILRLDPGPFGTRDYIQNVREGVADVVTASFTTDRCRETEQVFDDTQADPAEPSRALNLRVLTLAGYERLVQDAGGSSSPASAFFDAMDADELTQWVQRNQEQVDTCTITVDPDR